MLLSRLQLNIAIFSVTIGILIGTVDNDVVCWWRGGSLLEVGFCGIPAAGSGGLP